MKHLVAGSMLIVSLIAFLAMPVIAQASPMTEAHIERIRANCVEAQSTLGQLHANDALLRHNRGQIYESISTKLMTSFNSRVTLSKFDSSSLTVLTHAYEQQLDEFRTNYKDYGEAMTKTLRLNCKNQPVAFYDSVADTRTKRLKVYESTQALQKTTQDYRAAYEAFKQKFLQENKQ